MELWHYLFVPKLILGLLQIKQAATTTEIQETALQAVSSLSLLGFLSVIRTLSDRDNIILSALSYYLEGRLDTPLKQ